MEIKEATSGEILREAKTVDGLAMMLWPVLLELIVTGMLGNANQLILNRFSPAAVAATTAAGQFLTLVVNMYAIFSVGQSILLAPRWGAGNDREGVRILWTSLFDNVCFSLILSGLGVALIPRVLAWMHVPKELWTIGRGYLLVAVGCSMFQAVTLTFSAALRAMGKMKTVMTGNLLINGSCVVMNFLILVCVSKNRQTIILYAFAGIFAQVLGGLFFYLALRYDTRVRALQQNQRQRISFWEFWKGLWNNSVRIARLGFWGGMEGIIYLVSQTAVVSMVGILGTQALIVKGYSGNLITYMALPANAVPLVAATMIGMAVGQRQEEEMQRLFYKCLWVSLSLTGITCAVSLTFSRSFLSAYTSDEKLLRLCVQILLLDFAVELARCFAALLVVSLKAVGDVKQPFVMVIIGSILNLSISWCFGINLGWGLPGIWLGYGADLVFRSIVGMWCWQRHKKKKDYPIYNK